MAEITNYCKLNYTANDINDRLKKAGNAILKTEQTLTEEEKARVKANLGISDSDNNPLTDEQFY
jgi:hypothetical protein